MKFRMVVIDPNGAVTLNTLSQPAGGKHIGFILSSCIQPDGSIKADLIIEDAEAVKELKQSMAFRPSPPED